MNNRLTNIKSYIYWFLHYVAEKLAGGISSRWADLIKCLDMYSCPLNTFMMGNIVLLLAGCKYTTLPACHKAVRLWMIYSTVNEPHARFESWYMHATFSHDVSLSYTYVGFLLSCRRSTLINHPKVLKW